MCKHKTIILKQIENRRNLPVLTENQTKLNEMEKNTDCSKQNNGRFPALQHARRIWLLL